MKSLLLSDYLYELPEDRIAFHPKPERDRSKLLYYDSGKITHRVFNELPELLPPDAILFFNDTKVIPARLNFIKDTDAVIEIFLLEPIKPHNLYQLAVNSKSPCTWKCSIGNLKRWKEGTLNSLSSDGNNLFAKLIDRNEGLVEFSWDNEQLSFVEVIQQTGKVPLPPYIKRDATGDDEERYQTIYSKQKGAVAAPTAGLHFTEDVLKAIELKGIKKEFLTLHVSAGTFLPIKTDDAIQHNMHHEQIIINKQNVLSLLDDKKKMIAVGTTAMRSLESLYCWAVKLKNDSDAVFKIEKLFPYENTLPKISKTEAAQLILDYMDRHKIEAVTGETSIFIFPGYQFRVCDGLITNFHQPGSTLILLVAAFVGEKWRAIYNEALNNNYRFLSYGDSSLLLP